MLFFSLFKENRILIQKAFLFFLFLKNTHILMCALVPSPNAFLFVSQEFALVSDTADARYPAFDISQPDTSHINMAVAH